MNSNLALGIILVFAGVLVVNQVFYLKRGSGLRKGRRFLSSGGLFLLAVFCGFGFLSAGELDGDAEFKWKVGYALLGGLSVAGAVYMAWKRR